MTRNYGWWAVVLAISTHASCADPDAEAAHPSATAPLRDSSRDSLEPGALRLVPAEPVAGWTGPGGRGFSVARRTAGLEAGHSRPFGTIALPIGLRERAAGLTQYPCTSCHAGRRVVLADERVKDAHRNLQPTHPSRTGALCSTCHTADDVSRLAVKGDSAATFDQSYRLCAQCHFSQAESWAGGGHGKRLDGWQGRRVVMACTDCHDPHAPGVTPRLPFPGPELERRRSHQP